MATVQELQEEERRIRYVRFIVDFTSSVIMQGTLSRREAEARVSAARARILELFPGGEHSYELVYSRRFRRLLEEFAPPPALASLPELITRFPTQRTVKRFPSSR